MEVLATNGAGTCFCGDFPVPLIWLTRRFRFSGQVATASTKGEIRLFSEVEKNAKTLLPGLGGI